MNFRIGKQKGAILIFVFVILIGLTGIVIAVLAIAGYEIKSASTGLLNMQAFYIAEAGRAKARWALTTGEEDVGWSETDEAFGKGTYTVTTTDNGDATYTIVSEGYIPDDTNPIARRRVTEENIPTSGNLSLAATASASSVQAGNTAAKANDGDTNTKWKSSVNNGSWLKLDFGEGSEKSINKVIIVGAKKIDPGYSIQYSYNDVAWNNVDNPVEAPAWTVTFDAPDPEARYLRIYVNGNRPEIEEFESFGAGSGAVLGQGEYATSW